ncbi:MAG: phosphatidate cytidylyltransferase [Rubrivivax sp.]|jgi:phosphatidate cytidylyltransferase|nr:phosphatidate cytidylyltransferase [Rubrivivax sp.]
MLRTRIITALILVAVLLLALTVPSPWPFALVSLMLVAAAAWEWGRLNGAPQALSLAMGMALLVAGAAPLLAGWKSAPPTALWWAITALWVVAAAGVLRQGPAGWPGLPAAVRWGVGLVALWAAWLAMAHARSIGINFLLSLFCLVWMADVAAYFGGRRFGRRKLAPTISPGKSWEGVWSGMAGVLLMAGLWMALDRQFVGAGFDGPSLYTQLHMQHGLVMWPLLLVLCGFSVVGDLVESLAKRAAGAKDSSRLLPGHGGVLDRIDALLPALPAALAALSLASSSRA